MGLLKGMIVSTILVSSLSLVGCSKNYSGYKSTGEKTAVITPVLSQISRVEAIDWKVGIVGGETVSKGIRIKVDFPRLRLDDINDLAKKIDLDSWIVRVHKQTGYGSDVLGHFYIPMIKPGGQDSSLRVSQMEYGMVNIYYAAAAVSPRFENLKCPPFNHQLYIDNDDVELDDTDFLTRIMVNPADYSSVQAKLNTFGYQPTTLNAGMSLVGSYFVDVALFDSRSKTRRSSFLRLPQTVRVKLERTRPIAGCVGAEVPKRQEDTRTIQDFKFGR